MNENKKSNNKLEIRSGTGGSRTQRQGGGNIPSLPSFLSLLSSPSFSVLPSPFPSFNYGRMQCACTKWPCTHYVPLLTTYKRRKSYRYLCVYLDSALKILNTALLTVALTEQFLANVNSSSCSLYVVVRPSVCRLSVVCLSVTFVRPTQAIEIFGTFSSPFGTLAIC